MPPHDCPDTTTLRELLLGRLPGEQALELEEHLLRCDRCSTSADTVSAVDEVTVAFASDDPLVENEQILSDVIARGKTLHALHRRGRSSGDGRTLSAYDKDELSELVSLLDPPEQADELGRLGVYRVLQVLGAGGMGVVFQAEDQRLKRRVALKVMSPKFAADRSAKERFVREAQSAAAIEHDHIVHVYEVGECNQVTFIAMQLLRGESLQARLKRKGRLDQREILRIGRQVANGLAAAHQHGLIHRDVKPDNIWLESESDRVKILDFGLARGGHGDPGLTHSGIVLGTPRYMAPEQAQGKQVDARADLFSLGGVLYHLATGQPPFEGDVLPLVLIAVVQSEPTALESLCPDLHPDLAQLIMQLLSKEATDRPQSASDVVDRMVVIERKLTDSTLRDGSGYSETIEWRSSPVTRTTKNRTKSIALVSLALCALLITIFAGWGVGILFKVETQHGTLIVNLIGDGFAASIQGKTVKIQNAATGEVYSIQLDSGEATRPNLMTGQYQFLLETDSGIQVPTDGFTIRNGESTLVEVSWEPAAQAKRDPAEISRRDNRDLWPAGAPPFADAPFDSEQARQHQEAWATYLNVSVEYTNSIGMVFRLVPPGEFAMGSTPKEVAEALRGGNLHAEGQEYVKSEIPRHGVILTQPFYLAVHEVTQSQYELVTGKTPSYFSLGGAGRAWVVDLDTRNHPVELVSWLDAMDFCTRLSEREGRLRVSPQGTVRLGGSDMTGYRLPTEAEQEFACRAGTTTLFWPGDQQEDLAACAWFRDNAEGRTHAVGELSANPFGLYDMHGNVWEWTQDWWEATYYSQFWERPAFDPNGPLTTRQRRVIRGGHWDSPIYDCRSANRHAVSPDERYKHGGFRVALSVEAVQTRFEADAAPPSSTSAEVGHEDVIDPTRVAPPLAIAPFDAMQAGQFQEAWAQFLAVPVEYENRLGMRFRLIPPGENLRGVSAAEVNAVLDEDPTATAQEFDDEMPQHRTRITSPFYLSVTEITQHQWSLVCQTSPWAGKPEVLQGPHFPATCVSWYDAQNFVEKLSQYANEAYDLPTEAKWEYACRAGSVERYSFGASWQDLDRYAWFGNNCHDRGERWAHGVGLKEPNAFGLFDMQGNVNEWCADGYDATAYQPFAGGVAIDPRGLDLASERVARNGNWSTRYRRCAAAHRFGKPPDAAETTLGFRVAIAVESVKKSIGAGDRGDSQKPTEAEKSSDGVNP